MRLKSTTLLFVILLIFSTLSMSHAGLSPEDRDDYDHLSIGADVIPYDWFIRLKSSREKDLNGNWDVYLKENLEKRTGAFHDRTQSKYLSGVIGLSVTWSGKGPYNTEALKTDEEVKETDLGRKIPVRNIDGKTSIRMLGTTCAGCHTGNLKTDTNNYLIPGGQSNISLDWLLRDMMVSLVSLIFNVDDQLEEFLISFEYSPVDAKKLAKEFQKKTMKELRLKTILTLAANKLKIIPKLPGHTFVKEEEVIGDRLKALLKLTLHMDEKTQLDEELQKRMDFIAMLVAGTPKRTFDNGKWHRYLEVTASYGRIDAFNNAYNKILRNKNEKISLTAPVGYPPIWGINNKYAIHYTGNTNSVANRNIGLAVAAGALILNENYDSTIKFDNLYTLEKLIYKLDAPNWEEIFKDEEDQKFQVSSEKVTRGKAVFEASCIRCHNPSKVHDEYKYPLYEYPLLTQKKLGTDPQLSINIVKPLHPLKDEKSYPGEVYLSTTQNLMDSFFKKYNIDEETRKAYSFVEYRGKQWFKNVKVESPESSYIARDLSGIWATAPFLHNNSVPTLWDMLQKPGNRPKIFRVKDRKFDPVKVGLRDHDEDIKKCNPKNKRDTKTDHHQCIDTSVIGNSNAGHEFGTDLSENEKLDLIEYLKVIAPYSPSREPASVSGGVKPSQTPFLDEFDNIKLSKIPFIGHWLDEKDFLRHKLRTFMKWSLDDPSQMFKELRKHRPVEFVSTLPIKKFTAENSALAIVSKYEDVVEVLSRPDVFSARHVGYKLDSLGGHMLGTDLTDFNKVEKPWLRSLMPHTDYQRVFKLIGEYTEESFKKIEEDQKGSKTYRINLVDELGKRVPALLFQNYFGFSDETLDKLYEWSYWIQLDTFRNPTNKTKIRKKAIEIQLEVLKAMNAQIEKLEAELKKNGHKPIHDTVLERMILSPEVQNGIIKKERIAINMIGMLGASIDTIQVALLKSLEFFLNNPQQLEEARKLAKASDMKTLQKYVMESLRLKPASPILIRYAEEDAVIAKGTSRETKVPKGTSVIVGTYSAMRDPSVINNPETFDIERPESSYFLFGYGHHKCLGDHLASSELSIIMSSILLKDNLKYTNEDKAGLPLPEKRFLEYDAK